MKKKQPELGDLLYLLTIDKIGPGRIRRLLQYFDSVEEIVKSPVRKLLQIEGIDYRLAKLIKDGGDWNKVEEQLELIGKRKINCATIWASCYPAKLKTISDPPAILFYKGELKSQYEKSIAVVGTRNPSGYGKIITSELVRELASRGITIVSGLARGIDSIAHRTALQNGVETIAVLGCGVDRCYPSENQILFNQITEQGAVISEFFLGTGPDAVNFPRRNRIISGLSLGTVVVEAGDRSGSLITALYALDQNREVFAVPGNINSPKSRGSNRLINQGAKLVQSVEDILEEINQLSEKASRVPRPVPVNLGKTERKVLDYLSHEPKHIDKLVMELDESPATVLAHLLTLELMGLVQQLAGKMFVRL